MGTRQAATDICRTLFGVDVEVRQILDGRASNFLVSCGRSRWLLKLFQNEYTTSRIDQAAEFVAFIGGRGFPCSSFQPSINGNAVETMNGRAVVLIPWIDGLGPPPNTVDDPGMMRDIGALCGWLHRLAEEYPARGSFVFAGKDSSPETALRRLEKLGSSADADIAQEVGERCGILRRLGGELAASRAQTKRGIIHGDFFCSHAIFQPGSPTGVIDILGDLYYPGWELMRSYFQSVPSSSPVVLFREFIKGYRSERAISPSEVAAAYDTYLLQLTTSTYGLLPASGAKLREFGAWRTQMAIWLAGERPRLRGEFASA